NGSLWCFKSSLHTGLTTLLMPQTAVCGYFKFNLLGQANLMESVVPELHTVLQKLGLEQSKLPFVGFNSFPSDKCIGWT
ncbi:MAG TPA: hypothetical protein VIJ87_04895, partial [Pyrinomonadaceae bacterium]